MEVASSPIIIEDEINTIIKDLEKIAKNKKMKIETKISNKVKTINSDPKIFRKIVGHLLDNAIKFTEKGKVTIRIGKKKNDLEIIVSDTGIGIPRNKMKDIFQKFSHVENYLTRRHEGAGLGLPLIKGFVQKLKGEITIKSKEKVGTTVILKLPLN